MYIKRALNLWTTRKWEQAYAMNQNALKIFWLRQNILQIPWLWTEIDHCLADEYLKMFTNATLLQYNKFCFTIGLEWKYY